ADDHDAHDDHVAGQELRGVEHHEAQPAVGRDHFGRHQGRPAHPDADAHAGEYLGQGGLQDDVQDDLGGRAAHGVGGVDLLDRYRPDAGARRDGHGREDRQVDQENLGKFADAEPDDHQRQVGQWGQGPVELDGRIEDAARVAVHAHQDAHRYGGGAGQEERAEYPRQAGGRVLGQRRAGHAVGHG